MQNKPNFQKSQMNVNKVLTKDYEKKTLSEHGKNKPKQSQTNPISNQGSGCGQARGPVPTTTDKTQGGFFVAILFFVGKAVLWVLRLLADSRAVGLSGIADSSHQNNPADLQTKAV